MDCTAAIQAYEEYRQRLRDQGADVFASFRYIFTDESAGLPDPTPPGGGNLRQNRESPFRYRE